MIQNLKVTYKYTSSAYVANQWLRTLPDLIACDFEAAVKFTPEQIADFKLQLESATTNRQRVTLDALINATALDHPSKVDLTHLQVAWSDHEAFVFILDNRRIHDLILNFLVTTTKRQIWHNATFDFKHIYYHTGKLPIEFEDTQILAKTVLNHVEIHKAKTGLKELAGHKYGQWAISPDCFTKSQMYDKDLLLYAATDACATFWLWNSIKRHVQSEENLKKSTCN